MPLRIDFARFEYTPDVHHPTVHSMLSQAVEDYLKAIYKLHDGAAVTTTELARHLSVSSASVTNMMGRLATMKLVTYARYKGVRLTPAGEKIALEIIRHHRLLETYLREVMGYGWQQMHDEAEHLEHHISEEFEARIDELLGYPTHDPHGDPIPTRDGRMTELVADPLTTFSPGDHVEIRRLVDTDVDMLHLIEDLGLLPGTTCRVMSAHPVDGMTVRINDVDVALSDAMGRHIFAEATTP